MPKISTAELLAAMPDCETCQDSKVVGLFGDQPCPDCSDERVREETLRETLSED